MSFNFTEDTQEGEEKMEANAVKRKAVPPKIRFEIFKRDDFTCQYCKTNAKHSAAEDFLGLGRA